MLLSPGQLVLERAERYGVSYEAFLTEWRTAVQLQKGRRSKAQSRADLLSLNFARAQRIFKTYTPPPALLELLAHLPPQHWVVITEPWCGDSAQFLPPLAKLADSHPHLSLKILYRDQHLDIIDLFLTNGKRSIPKLITLSANGQVLFTWGPRPKAIQAKFLAARSAGIPKEELQKQLQQWYREDQFRSFNDELYHHLRTVQHTA